MPGAGRGTTSTRSGPARPRVRSPVSGRPEPTASDGATGTSAACGRRPTHDHPGSDEATETAELVGGVGRAQLPDQPGEQAVDGGVGPDDAEAAHLGEVDDQRRPRDRRVGAARPLDPGDPGGHVARAQPHAGRPAAAPERGPALLGGHQDGRRVGMGAVEPFRLAPERVAEPAARLRDRRRVRRDLASVRPPGPPPVAEGAGEQRDGPEGGEEQQLRTEEDREGDRHGHRGDGRDPRDARRDVARAGLWDSGSRHRPNPAVVRSWG